MDAEYYVKASKLLSSVFETCSNNRNVVLAILECDLQSTDKRLLTEGMKLIRILLKYAAQFLVDSTHEERISLLATMNLNFALGHSMDLSLQEKTFNHNTLLLVTYQLFDSSETCFYCSLNHPDNDFVSIHSKLSSSDNALLTLSNSE